MDELDFYDHAHTANPVVRWMVRGYLRTLESMLAPYTFESALDVGCGEGIITDYVARVTHATAAGIDTDERKLWFARGEYPAIAFHRGDGYAISYPNYSFDLVMATEVLEHQDDPDLLLREMRRVSSGYLFATVPHDTLWRIGNIVRGKYWLTLGNYPGHVQHWNERSFGELMSRFGVVKDIRISTVWLMALCEK